jgi:hypothetical protein
MVTRVCPDAAQMAYQRRSYGHGRAAQLATEHANWLPGFGRVLASNLHGLHLPGPFQAKDEQA